MELAENQEMAMLSTSSASSSDASGSVISAYLLIVLPICVHLFPWNASRRDLYERIHFLSGVWTASFWSKSPKVIEVMKEFFFNEVPPDISDAMPRYLATY